MSDDYAGLHGRIPGEMGHTWTDENGKVAHFVPEGWEDLDRGICPGCGCTVTWNHHTAEWVLEPALTVLVLGQGEIEVLIGALHAADRKELLEMVERQWHLNRPFEDPYDTYGTPEHEAVLSAEEQGR